MKCRYVFLFFFSLLFATKVVVAVSPAHGIWMHYESYSLWRNNGSPVYEIGKGQPWEWIINSRSYIGFAHNLLISNNVLAPFDGITWDILSFEGNGNIVIYHLASIWEENSRGTVTVLFVGADTIFFESYQGDDNFIEEIRNSSLRFFFSDDFLFRRVRLTR